MTVRARLRATAYRVAYRLPVKTRRRIVRIAMPKYIVGAVVLVRDSTAAPPGRILLIRQPPGYGWSIPGGLLDRGEVPAYAAARELHEEVGIRVDADELVALQPSAIVHTHGRWVDCVFEAHVAPDTPVRIAAGEVVDAAWHRLDALPPLTVPTARLLAHYGIGPYVGYPEAQF
ncbi:MAG TPA: NUDIX hydrolase [Micromonosporaceae bacterium]|jgi:ADP-ribose pyrophosphatase YjhB (NUDIX family)|nr:NUDIX hydrolase [Micromonosporaceae bacterium]